MIAVVTLMPIFILFLSWIDTYAMNLMAESYESQPTAVITKVVYLLMGAAFAGIVYAAEKIEQVRWALYSSLVWVILLSLNNFCFLFTLNFLHLADAYLLCFYLLGIYLFIFFLSVYRLYKMRGEKTKTTIIRLQELDKLRATVRLMAKLEEGEKIARENGWLSTDEVEAKLGL